jgi:hypothetical protein
MGATSQGTNVGRSSVVTAEADVGSDTLEDLGGDCGTCWSDVAMAVGSI